MDFFLFIMALMVVVGIALLIYSMVNFHGAADKAAATADIMNLESKLAHITSSVNEADEAYNSLSRMSQDVLQEFESKYQELLFLYRLVDEKQQDAEVKPVSKAPDKASINPRFDKILQMYRDGMGVDDIAKELGMGKGEVGLIINLGGQDA